MVTHKKDTGERLVNQSTGVVHAMSDWGTNLGFKRTMCGRFTRVLSVTDKKVTCKTCIKSIHAAVGWNL